MNDTHPAAPTGDTASPARQIENRLAACREALPGLIERAHRVERVHAGVPGVPAGLGDLLEDLATRLAVGMDHAEDAALSAMRAGKAPGAEATAALHAEHAARADALAGIRRLTGGITLPEGACRTWTALYDGLRALAFDLEMQTKLEDEALAAGKATDTAPQLHKAGKATDTAPQLHKGCACHG